MLRNARQVNETIRARSYGAKFTFCLLADNLEFCEIAKLSPLVSTEQLLEEKIQRFRLLT